MQLVLNIANDDRFSKKRFVKAKISICYHFDMIHTIQLKILASLILTQYPVLSPGGLSELSAHIPDLSRVDLINYF